MGVAWQRHSRPLPLPPPRAPIPSLLCNARKSQSQHIVTTRAPRRIWHRTAAQPSLDVHNRNKTKLGFRLLSSQLEPRILLYFINKSRSASCVRWLLQTKKDVTAVARPLRGVPPATMSEPCRSNGLPLNEALRHRPNNKTQNNISYSNKHDHETVRNC